MHARAELWYFKSLAKQGPGVSIPVLAGAVVWQGCCKAFLFQLMESHQCKPTWRGEK